jgi:hypothetical protein
LPRITAWGGGAYGAGLNKGYRHGRKAGLAGEAESWRGWSNSQRYRYQGDYEQRVLLSWLQYNIKLALC